MKEDLEKLNKMNEIIEENNKTLNKIKQEKERQKLIKELLMLEQKKAGVYKEEITKSNNNFDVSVKITDLDNFISNFNKITLDSFNNKNNYESKLIQRVIDWGFEKNILNRKDKIAQSIKIVEEAVETLSAVKADNEEEIIDGLGDVFVTIILLSKMYDKDIFYCLEKALSIIEKRKGKMDKSGFFVKDE